MLEKYLFQLLSKIALRFLLKFENKIDLFRKKILILITFLKNKNAIQNDIEVYLKEISGQDISIKNRVEKFKRKPIELSNSILPNDEELQEVIYLYSLAKRAIAIYESRAHHLPIQVYNEMRNALDHYLQALYVTSDFKRDQLEYRAQQIKYMQKHMHRALIDVIKLVCAEIAEEIQNRRRELHDKSLTLVHDGKFLGELELKKQIAETTMVHAKTVEYTIKCVEDDDPYKNITSVTDSFLATLIAHLDYHDFFRQNLIPAYHGLALWLRLNVRNTLVVTVVGGLLVKIIWDAVDTTPIINTIECWIIRPLSFIGS